MWVDVSQVRGGCASDMVFAVYALCGWYRRTAVFVVTKSDAHGPEDRETLWIERRTHDDCRAGARGPSLPSFRMRTRVPSESWPSTVYNNTIDRSSLSQASLLGIHKFTMSSDLPRDSDLATNGDSNGTSLDAPTLAPVTSTAPVSNHVENVMYSDVRLSHRQTLDCRLTCVDWNQHSLEPS